MQIVTILFKGGNQVTLRCKNFKVTADGGRLTKASWELAPNWRYPNRLLPTALVLDEIQCVYYK